MTAGTTDYAERDRCIAKTFGEAARRAGVQRIIYLGGLGETGQNLRTSRLATRGRRGSGNICGVPVTVPRAAMIIGSGSASFEILRYLVERLPVMITPKWVSTPCQPIAVRNVIAYLIGVLSLPETAGQIYDIGGPDVMNYLQIMHVMGEELGLRRRLVIPVPVLTPRLSSYWIHLVTPLSRHIATPSPKVSKIRWSAATIVSLASFLSTCSAYARPSRRHFPKSASTRSKPAGPWPAPFPAILTGLAAPSTATPAARKLTLPPAAVFRAVCRLGGMHHGSDWLWRIRGQIDLLAGGPGLRRGRRDSESIGYGEAIDFWRVVGFERDCRLTLRAEMKLPGEALLEFCVKPNGRNRCTLEQRAIFQPRGLFGILYWYSVLPFHNVVFSGMLRGIQRQALQFAAPI